LKKDPRQHSRIAQFSDEKGGPTYKGRTRKTSKRKRWLRDRKRSNKTTSRFPPSGATADRPLRPKRRSRSIAGARWKLGDPYHAFRCSLLIAACEFSNLGENISVLGSPGNRTPLNGSSACRAGIDEAGKPRPMPTCAIRCPPDGAEDSGRGFYCKNRSSRTNRNGYQIPGRARASTGPAQSIGAMGAAHGAREDREGAGNWWEATLVLRRRLRKTSYKTGIAVLDLIPGEGEHRSHDRARRHISNTGRATRFPRMRGRLDRPGPLLPRRSPDQARHDSYSRAHVSDNHSTKLIRIHVALVQELGRETPARGGKLPPRAGHSVVESEEEF